MRATTRCPARCGGRSCAWRASPATRRDFHDLATALARRDETGRDVYCLDYRGRGRSQYDPDWKNYSILVELNDALDFMAMKGLDRAAVVGTSRGGLIAMLMGVLRPNAPWAPWCSTTSGP